MGKLVSLVLCEAVALYGFILRVLGGPIQHTLLLYAGGFVLLILFTPRRPKEPCPWPPCASTPGRQTRKDYATATL